jgi:hypothetical protein
MKPGSPLHGLLTAPQRMVNSFRRYTQECRDIMLYLDNPEGPQMGVTVIAALANLSRKAGSNEGTAMNG